MLWYLLDEQTCWNSNLNNWQMKGNSNWQHSITPMTQCNACLCKTALQRLFGVRCLMRQDPTAGAAAVRVQRVLLHPSISSNRCIAPVLMNNGLENGPLAVRKGAFLQQKGDVCFFLILRLRGRSKSIHPIKTLASPLSYVGYVYGFCSFYWTFSQFTVPYDVHICSIQ